MDNKVKAGIFGVCVGDALGVPVEFTSREILKRFPVENMREFGSWNQPKGTWSDDSSLTLCIADELTKSYDLEKIGQSFVKWVNTDIGPLTEDCLISGEQQGTPLLG
ncbi:ADP-ribosylglycohydrolase family protein [Chryseobacterium nepalense]|uniref:ADP-ribosylglycohydrolase family protein n=1 Tax=Chryseobacterium nepalense TaxID=1854498 RepID=A0ABY4K4J6_9FLAO|nr:ADP-ribosylglycohydrolase family protein [Chryseobacterium nepalense]UPQ74693.1 ADP-ribosylglycohydrolase family protein [Chryseobacterium nepalense]